MIGDRTNGSQQKDVARIRLESAAAQGVETFWSDIGEIGFKALMIPGGQTQLWEMKNTRGPEPTEHKRQMPGPQEDKKRIPQMTSKTKTKKKTKKINQKTKEKRKKKKKKKIEKEKKKEKQRKKKKEGKGGWDREGVGGKGGACPNKTPTTKKKTPSGLAEATEQPSKKKRISDS